MVEDYQPYLNFSHQLADVAGGIAKKYFKQSIALDIKADQTPVTLADREIEAALREMILAKYPTHGIIGEEFGTAGEAQEYCWVLDPIDGTKAFVAGFPTFTTLIGLLHHGVPVVGLVDQPVLKERWIAIVPITVMSSNIPTVSQSIRGARLATTSMDYLSDGQKAALVRLKNQGANIIYSGDAYAYMMLVEGRMDVVFDVGLKPYDILPILPILAEKNLVVKFFEAGKVLDKPSGNVVAAVSENMANVILECLL
jgi:histidinol phosphatase-like enzyme (inositol monophosphatase family)